MANRPDFLDEIIDERSERNTEFPELVEAAVRRRQLLRELAARREELGLSQTLVAARMGTSQSAVARLEAGERSSPPLSVSRQHSARRSSGDSRRRDSRRGTHPAASAR
jgi:DNA-binding transcriptional regulator YiaG